MGPQQYTEDLVWTELQLYAISQLFYTAAKEILKKIDDNTALPGQDKLPMMSHTCSY